MGEDKHPVVTTNDNLGPVLLRALEQSPSIVLITDLKGIIEYVNPRFCEMTGYAREEVFGKNIRLMKSGQMDPQFYADLWAQIRENDEWRGELHNLKRSGEFYWESAVISAVRNADGIVEHYLKVAEDVTRLKEAEEQRDKLMAEMRVMAMQDALTGLYSRRMFDDELHRTWKTGERHNTPTGLLVIDIDYFKSFNDTYGHQVGDQILTEVARLIESTARAGDIVCRYGGDEIVVILPMTTLEATGHAGSRILEAFRKTLFCQDSHKLKVTASIGAAAGSSNSHPAHELLMRADQALYRAKQHGRNILCLADPNGASPFILLGETTEDAQPANSAQKAKKMATVLLLSQSDSLSKAVRDSLIKESFEILIASDANNAVEIVHNGAGRVDVVLLDQAFRALDQRDILREIWSEDDAIAAVLIVEAADMDNVAVSGRNGSMGILAKPVSIETIVPVLDQAVKQRNYLLEDRRYHGHLKEQVKQRNEKLQELLTSAKEAQQPVAQLMTVIFNAYERKTGQHCKRVEKIVRILAGEMNLSDADRDAIERGAFLHDIGKIGIPDEILMKKGPLTLDEWRAVRLHPQIGYDLLRDQPSLETASLIVLEHHERYDGTGYPHGKKGPDICMGARIFAVADTYDAIRASRPYAPSTPAEQALAEIVSHRGTLFDPDVVDAFAKCHPLIETNVSFDAMDPAAEQA